MSYLVQEQETTLEHSDDSTRDEVSVAVKELMERIAQEDEATRKAIEAAMAADLAAKTERLTLVCSCGFTRCPMIGMYGHPRPVFTSAIEPIPSQYARDVRALELKGQG